MPERRAVLLTSLSPYFNLAAEEYMLGCGGSFVAVWRNSPSVIIGRNQETENEINSEYIRANRIPVVRRITGGGAVYHDEGNVNFSFIEADASHSGSYEYFSAFIIDALKKYGINACLSGRNDLLLDGKKISGQAQCTRGGRVLHHGTLLYSADMAALENALRVSGEKLSGKGIKSVKSRVANLSGYIENAPDASAFTSSLFEELCLLTGAEKYTFTPEEEKKIAALAYGKYRADTWNFTRTAPGSQSAEKRLEGGVFRVNVKSENGVILSVSVYGDYLDTADFTKAENALKGVKKTYDDVLNVLESTGDIPEVITAEELSLLVSSAQ